MAELALKIVCHIVWRQSNSSPTGVGQGRAEEVCVWGGCWPWDGSIGFLASHWWDSSALFWEGLRIVISSSISPLHPCLGARDRICGLVQARQRLDSFPFNFCLFLYFPGWFQTQYMAELVLEFLILLIPPLMCWDPRDTALCLARSLALCGADGEVRESAIARVLRSLFFLLNYARI